MSRTLQYIICAAGAIVLPLILVALYPWGGAHPRYKEAAEYFSPIEEAPNPYRKIEWLDGYWEFRLSGGGDWHKVAVPHVWNAIPGLENYEGPAEYRLRFKFPKWKEGGAIRINFGGVSGRCEVFFNGHSVAANDDYYEPFSADVTGYVERKGENTLVVKVNNRPASGSPPYVPDEKVFGGIYREVYLERAEEMRFENVRIEARPSESSTATVRLTATATLPPGEGVMVFGRISSPDRQTVAEIQSTMVADQQGLAEFRWEGPIRNAELWDVGSPALYGLSLVMMSSTGSSDGIETSFGIRHPEWRRDGFYLNGNRMDIKGVVLREQYPGWGPRVTAAAIEGDFERIRLAGFNAVRFTHPPHQALLKYCDRHGYLAFVDFPLWKKPASGSEDPYAALDSAFTRFAERDDRHPSVIARGLGRDLDLRDEELVQWLKRTSYNLWKYDSGRLIYAATRSFEPDSRVKGVDFILSSVFPGWTDEAVSRYVKRLQSDKFMYGEAGDFMVNYGSGGTPGDRGAFNLKGTEAAQTYNLITFENALAGVPGSAGGFVDSFADYEGPRADPRGIANMVYTGLLTAEREPKLAFSHYVGIELDEGWAKHSRLPFRFPGADFFAFLLFLFAGFLIWSGFSKMWPAYIEPDLLGPISDEGRMILRNFLLFGLPMLLAAGAAVAFATACLLDQHPIDLARVPISAAAAANVYLKPFAMRLLTLTVLQISAFFLGSILLSFIYGREPLVLLDLLTRCTALRAMLVLIPFLPVSPWIVAALAVGWETYMQAGVISRSYDVSVASAMGVVAGLHTVVLSIMLAVCAAVFGGIGFLL